MQSANNNVECGAENILKISSEFFNFKKDDKIDKRQFREKIEPWLTAIFQSEHPIVVSWFWSHQSSNNH